MRIIAGEYKGRRLKAVPGTDTRPTTDKVKESVFNIIGPYFDGGFVLDMFAGSGGLSIEAVSRGMDHAILFEKNRKALATIRANIEITKEPERFTVLPGDARKNARIYAEKHPEAVFSLVLLDPPYAAEKMAKDILLLEELGLIDQRTTIVCEMAEDHQLPEEIAGLQKVRRVKYGTIAVEVFWSLEGGEEDEENSFVSGEL